MELVVITAERQVPDEAMLLQALFEEGLDWLHIRKPGMPMEEVEALVTAIPACWHSRIIIHEHAPLYEIGDFGGLHVWLKNLARAEVFPGGELSTSAHSMEEFYAASLMATRVFISPLFNSISKPGYTAEGSLKMLGLVKRTNKLVALGGVCAHHLPELEMWGFDAAALMGFLWQYADPVARFREAISARAGISASVGKPQSEELID